MTESDNSFEEYEFDDDLDDPWDDVLDDDDEMPHEGDINADIKDVPRGSSRKKSKSILKPILSLAILGGVSFAAYSFLMPSPEENRIPIIKINNALEPELVHKDDTNTKIEQTETIPQQTQIDNAEESHIENAPITQSRNTVLTPMPEDIMSSALTLPKLETLTQNDIEPEANASKDLTKDRPKTLSEDELLSKTESVYEKIPESSPITEDLAPKVPTPPPPKEEAVQEKLVEKVKPAPQPPKEIAKKPAKIEKNISKKVQKTPKNTEKSKNKVSWTVRAAQPGKAVVYNKSSKEMKSIEVNDTLTGIGRIKSIELKNGRWVITGTKGKILQ